MRLIDAILNVRIPEDADQRWRYTAPEEPICESLGISGVWNWPDAVDLGLKAFPIFNWICTDEHVGLDALYLNGEAVGCSYRSARKNHYEIEWISAEAATKVREFILSNMERPAFTLLDPDQDIGEDFCVHFVGQNLSKEGFVDGRAVTVIGGYDIMRGIGAGLKHGDERYNKFIVKDGDEERLVSPEDLRFSFNLKD